MLSGTKILVVADDEGLTQYLREKLLVDGGYYVTFENNFRLGLESFRENSYDIVIIKLTLPDIQDDLEFIRNLKRNDPDSSILAFIDEENSDQAKELLRSGIYGFLSRPFNLEKLFFLVKKGIELHSILLTARKLTVSLQEQNVALQKQNTLLAKRIEESTKNLTRLYEDLRSTYMRTIKTLAHAIDARDHYTHSHSENVAKYAEIIAEEMRLSVQETSLLRDACELHDLGKIGIGDSILLKPSALTDEEWKEIKRHPEIAAQILEPLTFLGDVVTLVKQHHEHYDGTGYPHGFKGDEIRLPARIIHLADAYEAMRSARSYRKVPLSMEQAVAEISKHSGSQFDPKVVEAFLKVVNRIEAVL